MKKYLIVAVLLLGACASNFMGTETYVPIGPQNLSRQVEDSKNMPVFSNPDQVSRPCSRIAFYQVQRLPNDVKVIQREVAKIKELAAKKGANAIFLKQYVNEDNRSYPVSLSSYFLKYLDTITEEDEQKIIEFANSAVVSDNAR